MVRRPTPAASLVAACLVLGLSGASALATPGSLEFGKCTKTAGGKFKNPGCTKLAKGAEEQKFEWTPLSAPVAFTTAKKAEAGRAVISVSTGTEVSCAAERSTAGELGPGSKEQKNIVVEFTGCESIGLGTTCQSAGQQSGTIQTLKLDGAPGAVKREAKEEKNLDGVDFKGQASEVFAEFSCGPVPVVLRGSIIVLARAAGKLTTNKMLNKVTLEFGVGTPERFEGEPPDVLEGSVSGGPFAKEEMSLIAIEQTSPKTTKVELRQCEKNVC